MGRLKRSQKIALKTSRQGFDDLKTLAFSVLGAKEVYADSGLSALTMHDGSLLELYNEGACYPEYLFRYNQVVVSFHVKDINKALSAALKIGIHPLTGIIQVCSTLAYCHLELKGGTVIGLYQEGQIPR